MREELYLTHSEIDDQYGIIKIKCKNIYNKEFYFEFSRHSIRYHEFNDIFMKIVLTNNDEFVFLREKKIDYELF